MGRYYDGDIEGKFWFGVQRSDAAERFGSMPSIHFYFSSEQIPDVEEEINNILENLGEYKQKLDDFFEKNRGYNDEMLVEAGFPKDKIEYLLSEYADLGLGYKILSCLKENGECSFDCEV